MKSIVHLIFGSIILLLFSTAVNSKALDKKYNHPEIANLSLRQNQVSVSKNSTFDASFQVKDVVDSEDLDQNIDDQFDFSFSTFEFTILQNKIVVASNLKKTITHSAHKYPVRLFILFNSLMIP